MYTVHCEHFGTGEGVTYAVVITKGYGNDEDRRMNALQKFRDKFGGYLASGATVEDGINLDIPGAEFLISDALEKFVAEHHDKIGGLEYSASIHFNFS